jgi:hypothetical protein
MVEVNHTLSECTYHTAYPCQPAVQSQMAKHDHDKDKETSTLLKLAGVSMKRACDPKPAEVELKQGLWGYEGLCAVVTRPDESAGVPYYDADQGRVFPSGGVRDEATHTQVSFWLTQGYNKKEVQGLRERHRRKLWRGESTYGSEIEGVIMSVYDHHPFSFLNGEGKELQPFMLEESLARVVGDIHQVSNALCWRANNPEVFDRNIPDGLVWLLVGFTPRMTLPAETGHWFKSTVVSNGDIGLYVSSKAHAMSLGVEDGDGLANTALHQMGSEIARQMPTFSIIDILKIIEENQAIGVTGPNANHIHIGMDHIEISGRRCFDFEYLRGLSNLTAVFTPFIKPIAYSGAVYGDSYISFDNKPLASLRTAVQGCWGTYGYPKEPLNSLEELVSFMKLNFALFADSTSVANNQERVKKRFGSTDHGYDRWRTCYSGGQSLDTDGVPTEGPLGTYEFTALEQSPYFKSTQVALYIQNTLMAIALQASMEGMDVFGYIRTMVPSFNPESVFGRQRAFEERLATPNMEGGELYDEEVMRFVRNMITLFEAFGERHPDYDARIIDGAVRGLQAVIEPTAHTWEDLLASYDNPGLYGTVGQVVIREHLAGKTNHEIVNEMINFQNAQAQILLTGHNASQPTKITYNL